MAEAPQWMVADLAEEIQRALAEGGAGDGSLVEGRAVAVKASPARGNSSKLVMGTSCLPPNFSTDPHAHEAEEVTVVLSGGGRVDIGGDAHPLEKGMVLFAPSNIPHQTHSGPDGLTVLWFYAPPGSEARWTAPAGGGGPQA